MRLISFLDTIDPASKHGTFVGARLTRDTEDRLWDWLAKTGMQNPEPKNRMHVTVVGHESRQFPWQCKEYPPLEVDPSTYHLEEFPGKDGKALVLRFDSPELQKRHQWAKDTYGFEWKHPEYLPHITLGYNTGINPKDLPEPDFPLFIAREYTQPWDFGGTSRAERRRPNRDEHHVVVLNQNQE